MFRRIAALMMVAASIIAVPVLTEGAETTVTAPEVSGSEAFNPQSLIGEWVGSWTNEIYGSGEFRLRIDKLSGGQVRGSIYIGSSPKASAPYHNHNLPFTGKASSRNGALELHGLVMPSFELTKIISGKILEIKLIVRHSEMAGWGKGYSRSEIALRKIS